MKETRIPKEGGSVAPPEDTKDISRMIDTLPKKSREPFWGAVLFACMILFVLASIGGIGWVAYSEWKSEKMEKAQPSIKELLERSNEAGASSVESPQVSDTVQPTDVKEQPAIDSIEEAKKLEISVLNGGATKGSAGILADFLKKEGYLKTDMGNTQKDYAGITIYYAVEFEKEAEMIKTTVIKKYPQAKILPADKLNKETTVSQVTIILGK